MDGQASILELRERHHGFQRRVHDLLCAKCVFKHMVCLCECLDDVTATNVEVECDVGVFSSGQMLQVGKGACGLEFVVYIDVASRRLDLVENRRQFLILYVDEMNGFFGNIGVTCQHDGHRLADVMHLTNRKNGLVMKGGAVVR